MSKEREMEQKNKDHAEGHEWGFTVWNSTNDRASDVHVQLSGTGGSLRNPRIVVEPAGCSGGQASISPDGNQVDVVWDSDCVKPGDTVVIIVETEFVPLDIVSVVWTRDNKPIPENKN